MLITLIRANNITAATIDAIDQVYAALPQVELSVNMRLDALLPNFPRLSSGLINTMVDFKEYLAADTKQPATDFDTMQPDWTMIQVLDTVCTNGQSVWQNLGLQRTW